MVPELETSDLEYVAKIVASKKGDNAVVAEEEEDLLLEAVNSQVGQGAKSKQAKKQSVILLVRYNSKGGM